MNRKRLTTWVWVAALALAVGLGGCGGKDNGGYQGYKVIVLGFDGMDYELTQRLMDEGRMPAFASLAAKGLYSRLDTAMPPQSPVAWSDFITGADSGVHGIFDFVHREHETLQPYLSTSRTSGSEKSLRLGKYKIPVSGGDVELLRHGKAFWEILEEQGVESHILRIPANFPPTGKATVELSGMGTPDILGTPGTFSFYTSDLFVNERQVSGGAIYALDYWDNHAEGTLYGPENPYLIEQQQLKLDFELFVDPDEPVAKLQVGNEERVLQKGEWSDWVTVEFEMIPTQTLSAAARFYLRALEPEVELYVSPLQIDPLAPAMPISTPEDYVTELAGATGRFYTQGMPEDTKALSEGVFTPEEYLAQAKITGDELIEQYHYLLEAFEGDLLFYYFGNLDLISHMMYRAMDPGHPAYNPEKDPAYREVVEGTYEAFDAIVGYTLERIEPDTRLVVMSDHGFSSWRRAFHLNNWLVQEGYMTLQDPDRLGGTNIYNNVDWSRTRAYGMGLNGVYINLEGREKEGIVPPAERDTLMRELSERLLAAIDPDTGLNAVTRMYPREMWYSDGGYREIGPDLQVGYAKRYRCSFESAIGDFADEVISDNHNAWSGDHCMDHMAVPGILLTNHPLKRPAKSLKELNRSILAEFGIEAPDPATGGGEALAAAGG